MEDDPGTANLSAPCRLLQTLSDRSYSELELNTGMLFRLFKAVKIALAQQMENPAEEWIRRGDQKDVFTLATSCLHLYDAYKVHILSSCIIPTLKEVSGTVLGVPIHPHWLHEGVDTDFAHEVEKLAKLSQADAV
jgi:hypothetical protein